MAQHDAIGDMIIRIKNAAAAGKETLVFSHTKITAAVATVLERIGYIEVLPKKGKKIHRQIEAKLVFVAGVPKFKDAKRISKTSKRVYRKIKNVAPVKSGFGHFILSTPKGILTDSEARKEHVGGEALFKIW